MRTDKVYYSKKIDFIISQLNYLKKYYKKTASFINLISQLNELKEFNEFLHRVIEQKEKDIKYYEQYKTKYHNLKDRIYKSDTNKYKVRDRYGRPVDQKTYFPFV